MQIFKNSLKSVVNRLINIEKTNKVFNYLSSGLKIKDSNLLAKRVKIGFPAWSNVNVNINSNTLKLLEPLHSIYSSVYSKSNEYLLQSFDLDYEHLIFKRVFLKNYPKVISYREVDYFVV